MVTDNRELISALVDDETSATEQERMLELLQQDAGMQSLWNRYHLIGDALHDHVVDRRAFTLHERVWQSLEGEPTVLAPRRHTRLPPLAKQAAGLAIAASVAALAILSVQYLKPVASGGEAGQWVQARQAAPQTSPQVVAAAAPRPEEAAKNAPPKVILNPYLVKHNEYSAASGMQGVLPYVRIVSHEDAR